MTGARNKDIVKITIPVNINFSAGLVVGLSTGIGLHPIDRALYLRATDELKDRQHLFAPKYWTNPMTGLRNTIYQRILSNGIYFALQGELNSHLYSKMKNEWQWGDKTSKAFIGLTAGGITGFVANASYAVKFYTISHKPKGRPLENTLEMWRHGGFRPFFNGVYPGVGRDVTFGVLYEVTNVILDQYILNKIHNIVPEENNKTRDTVYFLTRFFSAGVATTVSSPLNYARNMQFKTKPHVKQPNAMDILCDVWKESSKALKAPVKNAQSKQAPGPSCFSRLKFFQSKFMIGAGTIRAAGGMALGQVLFNKASEYIRSLDAEAKQEGSPRNKI